MRAALFVMTVVGALLVWPASASADVANCGGQQSLGLLTCTTSGPAMIDGTSFVGDGGSSAQLQWSGSTTVSEPGALALSYVYTGIYNTLFAKIGLRLTVNQPGCDDPHESTRVWIDPATADGVAAQLSVPVHCAGPVDYTVTSRAATYSLGGSFIGNLSEPVLTVTP